VDDGVECVFNIEEEAQSIDTHSILGPFFLLFPLLLGGLSVTPWIASE